MYLAAAKRKNNLDVGLHKVGSCDPGLSRWARASKSITSSLFPGHHQLSLWPLLCFMQYSGMHLPVTGASGIHAGQVPPLCVTKTTVSWTFTRVPLATVSSGVLGSVFSSVNEVSEWTLNQSTDANLGKANGYSGQEIFRQHLSPGTGFLGCPQSNADISDHHTAKMPLSFVGALVFLLLQPNDPGFRKWSFMALWMEPQLCRFWTHNLPDTCSPIPEVLICVAIILSPVFSFSLFLN